MIGQDGLHISATGLEMLKKKLLSLLKEANRLSEENDLETYWKQQLDTLFEMERHMSTSRTTTEDKRLRQGMEPPPEANLSQRAQEVLQHMILYDCEKTYRVQQILHNYLNRSASQDEVDHIENELRSFAHTLFSSEKPKREEQPDDR